MVVLSRCAGENGEVDRYGVVNISRMTRRKDLLRQAKISQCGMIPTILGARDFAGSLHKDDGTN